jgi:hypothetical protein
MSCAYVYENGYTLISKAIEDAQEIGKRATISDGTISIDMDAEHETMRRITEAIGTTYMCDLISQEACEKYYATFGEEFLFSDLCVSYEIREHVYAYYWSIGEGPANTIAKGYNLLGVFQRQSGYFDRGDVYSATRSIDMRERDVASGMQAFIFGYKNGIRDIYIGTYRDPWADER